MSLIDLIAKTTDEEMLAHVNRVKRAVITEAQKTTVFNSEALLAATYRVAEAEVRMAVYLRVQGIVNNDAATQAEKREALMICIARTLAEGADDAWSGRKNDLQRVKDDERRKTLRQILEVITYNPEWKVGA